MVNHMGGFFAHCDLSFDLCRTDPLELICFLEVKVDVLKRRLPVTAFFLFVISDLSQKENKIVFVVP